ncbi:MAG: T9SS type A sorting domain-containing protein [Calditrichaceae bacterium]
MLNENFFIHRLSASLYLMLFIFLIIAGNAQDLTLEDMTVTTAEVYEAENSITAGPDFTIASAGTVTFKSGNLVILNSGFNIIKGGKLTVINGISTDLNEKSVPEIPGELKLMQNYPNPFNPVTNISYRLNENGHVKVTIYDLLGREIETLVSEYQNAGSYQITYDAGKLVSGIYLYKLTIKGRELVRKMILLK